MSNFDVRAFNLNLVPSLAALLRHRAVGAAAREVGVSQSAMSHALAKLRAVLDDPLLVPQGRGFVLSARAQELAVSLPRALEQLGAALGGGAPFDPSTASFTVRIASVDYFEFTALSSVMAYLRTHAPGVRLSLERLTADSAAALQGGGLDFILGGTGLVRGAGLDHAVLYDDPFKVIARAGHPKIRRRLSLGAYLAVEHVVVRFEGRRAGVVDRVLASMNLERRVGLWVPHFVSAPLVVAESDMISTVASAVAERAKALLGVQVFSPPLELPAAPVTMWWPKAQEHDPARTWFRRLVFGGELLPAAMRRRIRAKRDSAP
jgi:DNA-binding transcriptional LysR family regulator